MAGTFHTCQLQVATDPTCHIPLIFKTSESIVHERWCEFFVLKVPHIGGSAVFALRHADKGGRCAVLALSLLICQGPPRQNAESVSMYGTGVT